MYRIICAMIFAITVWVIPCFSAVLDVPGTYPTIQDGIDAAVAGDTVLVADGTYSGDGNRDITFRGKAITVMSANGPDTCIIECEGTAEENHRGFYFHQYENANAILEGFTIQGGFVSENYGGGAVMCEYSDPTIRHCAFSRQYSLMDSDFCEDPPCCTIFPPALSAIAGLPAIMPMSSRP